MKEKREPEIIPWLYTLNFKQHFNHVYLLIKSEVQFNFKQKIERCRQCIHSHTHLKYVKALKDMKYS